MHEVDWPTFFAGVGWGIVAGIILTGLAVRSYGDNTEEKK